MDQVKAINLENNISRFNIITILILSTLKKLNRFKDVEDVEIIKYVYNKLKGELNDE
jgi:hypothetical protein